MTGATNISYNSNSLQGVVSGGFQIITSDIDHFSNPDKSAKMFPLAHANASALPFIAYPSRTIKVSGYLLDTTIANLDADIDTFKGYFTGQDQNLDIDYNGGTRRYTATANNVTITRPVGLLYAKFSIEFICTNPFGQAITSNTLLDGSSGHTGFGRTSASYTDAITLLGNAPQQRPVITITLTAVSDASGGFITISNNTTGQGITVSRTWAAGDVLVIDCAQKIVTVNGVAFVFSGAFPEFAPGSGSINYTDNFTSRTMNENVTQTALFL